MADLSGSLVKNMFILVCEVGYSSVTEMYMEGTIVFVNKQWENTPTEYYKYITDVHFDNHTNTISLFSSNNNNLKPVIVKYTNPNDEADIKYYFALLFTRGGHMWNKILFNGIYNIEMLKTCIGYSGTTLPDGYEIYQEALPMRKLNLVSGYIGDNNNSYSYADIKSLEDRITALESV